MISLREHSGIRLLLLFSLCLPSALGFGHLVKSTDGSFNVEGMTSASRREAVSMMGRAEKRMAKKRSKKGQQYQGGRPSVPIQQKASTDTVPKDVVASRLGEVPVFGLRGLGLDLPSTDKGWLAGEDGTAIFYMDAREAKRAASALEGAMKPTGSPGSSSPKPRVEGVPLDTVYWDKSATLKPSESAVQQLGTIPAERCLVPDVRTPLFCIDGMQTTDKTSGIESLPMFFSKAEILEFANPVYGEAEAKNRVLVTDLEVVVVNMVRGPAGPLRTAKFFAEAGALTAMDKQEAEQQQAQSLFPTSMEPEAGLFGGMKMPWQ